MYYISNCTYKIYDHLSIPDELQLPIVMFSDKLPVQIKRLLVSLEESCYFKFPKNCKKIFQVVNQQKNRLSSPEKINSRSTLISVLIGRN